jgi:putative methanogenesis marker protein 8
MTRPERDLHVLKYFSSVIAVSEGKVLHVTEPSLRACPLASHFFQEFKKADPTNIHSLRDAIQKAIESKIRNYGFFTKNRSLHFPQRVVPYGASEMLAASLKHHFIDAAVTVCDGAGTVISTSPETTQGIGARMNTLIFTSPVKETLKKLKTAGCHIVSNNDTLIDQVKGFRKAVALGFKKIGMTIAGSDAEKLEQIRSLEKKEGATAVILAVCTSGISANNLGMIRRHADLAWACASGEARKQLGSMARLQISKQIPVYALTEQGVAFVASCLEDPSPVNRLDTSKQYLLSKEPGGQSVRFGSSLEYIRESVLPANAKKTPSCSFSEN